MSTEISRTGNKARFSVTLSPPLRYLWLITIRIVTLAKQIREMMEVWQTARTDNKLSKKITLVKY
jgi:hypothetical protein